ncbi:hypothetical protein ACFL59_09170 [Planctomycetota bacterium]
MSDKPPTPAEKYLLENWSNDNSDFSNVRNQLVALDAADIASGAIATTPWVYESEAGRLKHRGRSVDLTAAEGRLFILLERIFQSDPDARVSAGNITVQTRIDHPRKVIQGLRPKLHSIGLGIESGRGYRLTRLLIIRGAVCSGVGRVTKIDDAAWQCLCGRVAQRLFKGSLGVRPADIGSVVKELHDLPCAYFAGSHEKGRLHFWRATLHPREGKRGIGCFAVRLERSGADYLELYCHVKLRKKYGLVDGDEVEVRVMASTETQRRAANKSE